MRNNNSQSNRPNRQGNRFRNNNSGNTRAGGNRFGRNNNRNGGSSNFRSGGNRFGKNNSRNNNFNRTPLEMHKATCSKCKKECEVPFKPTEGKPVYCKECFEKQKPRRF